MALYTLSKCVLENLNVGNKKYITDLLFVFAQGSNPHKITIDFSNVILDIYETIAGQGNEFVSTWLTLMSHQPSKFETINVDLSSIIDQEEIFLKVCSATNGQQSIIVYTHQGWQKFTYYAKNTIHYNNTVIDVLDRDEAVCELNSISGQHIVAINSIVATNQSTIIDTENQN